MTWSIEYHKADFLDELLDSLPSAWQGQVVAEAMDALRTRGLELLKTNMMKNLGGGLFELRIRRSPDLLLRVFLTMIHPRRLILLSAYNKQRDPSDLRQRREIRKARNLIEEIQGRK